MKSIVYGRNCALLMLFTALGWTFMALIGCVNPTLVQTLVVDVEKLKQENESLKTDMSALKDDVDQLNSEMEKIKQPEAVNKPDTLADVTPEMVLPTPSPPPAPEVDNAEMYYTQGQNYYHSGQFREAASAFEKVVVLSIADPELASRGYYWLGECYYAQNSFDRALEFFQKVFNNYGNESKAPDALLKIGFTYCELKAYNKAVQVLEEFLRRFPNHRAVSLAEGKISEIKNLQHGEPIQPD
ncbi:tetratricopeptide repeat protein [bacterium]|nr:tetratricopeptide repeat protein [candidate division CSSED10-310 bacterium]